MTTDLLAEFKAAQAQNRPIRCPVGKALVALDEKDRGSFELALRDLTLQGTVIAKLMTGRGHAMTDDSVQRHRREECSCSRTFGLADD